MCKLSHSWECGVCILPSYEMLSIQTFRAPVIISGAAPRVGERGTRSPLHCLRRTALRSYSMSRSAQATTTKCPRPCGLPTGLSSRSAGGRKSEARFS